MNVAIRVDSSVQIGSGHLMRCLTLAKALKKNGAEVLFVCRDHSGNISGEVTRAGFTLRLLSTDDKQSRVIRGDEYAQWLGVTQEYDARQTIEVLTAEQEHFDWLIIDHYGLDQTWQRMLSLSTEQIMVIDDLANRKHECDVILDQNLYEYMESRYDELVPPDCVKLLGPQYALLRDEFVDERASLRIRDGVIKRVMVFYGGSDNSGETLKAIQAIIQLGVTNVEFDIIVGSSNKDKNKIEHICSEYSNLIIHSTVSNMAELMAKADLALGAGGTTTYERYCLGLPTIVTAVAENQVEAAKFAFDSGLNFYIGESKDVSEESIANCLRRLLNDSKVVELTSYKIMKLLDGNGCQRMQNIIMDYTSSKASKQNIILE